MQQIKDCDKLSALAYPHPTHMDDAIMSDANVREYLNELQNHGCKLICLLYFVFLMCDIIQQQCIPWLYIWHLDGQICHLNIRGRFWTKNMRLNSENHRFSGLCQTDNKCLDAVPPIPGYRGFIPHVRTSDVGLGSRFHNMAREGYDALYTQRLEQEQQKDLSCDADAANDAVQPLSNDRYAAVKSVG